MSDVPEMEGLGQMACKLNGLRLLAAAKLPEEAAAKQLLAITRAIREDLINLGLRKRKTRKVKADGVEGKKSGKGKK